MDQPHLPPSIQHLEHLKLKWLLIYWVKRASSVSSAFHSCFLHERGTMFTEWQPEFASYKLAFLHCLRKSFYLQCTFIKKWFGMFFCVFLDARMIRVEIETEYAEVNTGSPVRTFPIAVSLVHNLFLLTNLVSWGMCFHEKHRCFWD